MGSEYFKIGKFVSVFSLSGELILQHSLGKKTSLKGIEALFIEDAGDSFLPYFVSSARIKSDAETYIQLEQINTRESARKFVQKEVWLSSEDFKKFAAKSAPISFLGYQIIDGGKNIGTIIEVIEMPHQVLCKINMQGEEKLIPLHEQTLERIDNKTKKIYVTLPDGLLEL
ncbi:16S rRNA processing protein RimM [Terrimonas sp.]|uniref:ribosome maturation factor RimM n=1 Tax=Terrimonas sp. TaxID=1914338 RepID=UPI000D5200D4|nr:16S rRNA processing protein RimM [Terrimonas sp.]PVD54196.1 16S rRNA processing protein RimM [Terrimonas sp.]